MTEKIVAALEQLDPKNDNHWTADLLPRLEAVKLLASDQSVTRAMIEEAMPGFTRAGKAAVTVISTPPETSDASAQTGSGMDDTQAESLQEEPGSDAAFERAKARMVAAAERKAAAHQEYAQAVQEVDVHIQARESAGQNETLADHLAGYFEGQRLIREQRARRTLELRGVSLKDLLPSRAPIDNAMARKTGMGMKRPVRT